MPGIVENIRHKLGGNIMASKGVGIRAASKPMSSYKRKPGERHGHHWYIPNINKTGEFSHVAIDTNYWKTFVHERFFVAAGDHGSMTIFGKGGHQHALFAEHVAGSEGWVRDRRAWSHGLSMVTKDRRHRQSLVRLRSRLLGCGVDVRMLPDRALQSKSEEAAANLFIRHSAEENTVTNSTDEKPLPRGLECRKCSCRHFHTVYTRLRNSASSA